MLNHRVTKLIVAFAIGISLSVYSYRVITDPEPSIERARQEAAVFAARELLIQQIGDSQLETVDPLAPDRVVGKSYIYPDGEGWQVSGFYRRGGGKRWHPFLMKMDQYLKMTTVSVRDADPGLAERAKTEPRLEIRQ